MKTLTKLSLMLFMMSGFLATHLQAEVSEKDVNDYISEISEKAKEHGKYNSNIKALLPQLVYEYLQLQEILQQPELDVKEFHRMLNRFADAVTGTIIFVSEFQK